MRVVCSHGTGNRPDDDEVDGVPVRRVPLLEGLQRRSPSLLLKAQRAIREVAEQFRPEVVQLHAGWPMVPAYLGCAPLRDVPLVLTVHDIPDASSQYPTIVQLLRRAERIVTNSRARLADVLRFDAALAGKAECLFVGRPEQAPVVDEARSPHPLVFMAGRQVREKGFDLAIDAFAGVLGRHPDARLVLAGDGPEHAALGRQIDALSLGHAVALPGVLSEESIAHAYAHAWVTLLPSRHSESFGLVALEAMQAGCAVLASRAGGIPEVVLDGVTGRLVTPDSTAELAQALDEMLADPQRTLAMGEAARARARQVFGWRECVARYEAVLRQVARS